MERIQIRTHHIQQQFAINKLVEQPLMVTIASVSPCIWRLIDSSAISKMWVSLTSSQQGEVVHQRLCGQHDLGVPRFYTCCAVLEVPLGCFSFDLDSDHSARNNKLYPPGARTSALQLRRRLKQVDVVQCYSCLGRLHYDSGCALIVLVCVRSVSNRNVLQRLILLSPCWCEEDGPLFTRLFAFNSKGNVCWQSLQTNPRWWLSLARVLSNVDARI